MTRTISKTKIDGTMRRHLHFIFTTCLLASVACFTASAQHLIKVEPEQVGLDSRQFQWADSAINAEISRKAIPGAVLAVTRHGKLAYLKAYGNKRVYPKMEPMTSGTIFDMASCTKPVATATSVMMLVEQGKIRLLDPVSRYIPEFQNWKQGTKDEETIRVIHLLTHTSGLPSYASADKLKREAGSPNPKAMMAYIDSCQRLNSPETKFRYSCLNYITLQNIVQRVSGQSLKDFTHDYIFAPLGMTHTGFQPKDSLLSQIAPTEKQPDGSVLLGKVHDPLARVMNGGISGNAGLFASAEDLCTFVSMLLNGGEWNGVRILSPQTVKALMTVPRGFERFGRSLGWDLYSPYASCNGDLLSPQTFGHTGYTGTSIVVDPTNDLGIILLTNAVHPVDKSNVVRLRSVIANIVASSIMHHPRNYSQHYYDRKALFANQPALTSKDIIMLGDSHIEGGRDWAAKLGQKHVINLGIAGDEALGVFDRLDPIVKAHPRRIYLMVGINDISHTIDLDSILGNIKLVVHKIRTASPQTQLYVQSLLPINETTGRWRLLVGKTALVPRLNAKLKALAVAEGAVYLDLYSLFKDKDSDVLPLNLTVDGLHLNSDGYAIWVNALKKTL